MHHATLLIGPSHSGKRDMALSMAAVSLGANEGSLLSHPDFMMLPGESVSMDDIRGLIHRLSLKSFYNKAKVAVLCDVDEYNIFCLNALLKTLEEPKGESFIILTTKNSGAVPATIKSRCQKISMKILSRDAFFVSVAARDITQRDGDMLYAMSYGNPVRGKYLLKSGTMQLCKNLYDAIISRDFGIVDKFQKDIWLFKDLLEVCFFMIFPKRLDISVSSFKMIMECEIYNLDPRAVMVNALSHYSDLYMEK